VQKRIISSTSKKTSPANNKWLDLENLAEIEITSEDPQYPIEGALLPEKDSEWRAADAGIQTIRLLFRTPVSLRHIQLCFNEAVVPRTQEFVLRWSSDLKDSLREIIRQQWNFSPHGATSEIEDFRIDLPGVQILELLIIPDINGGHARASLARLRLA